jgi:hypothetical protein
MENLEPVTLVMLTRRDRVCAVGSGRQVLTLFRKVASLTLPTLAAITAKEGKAPLPGPSTSLSSP